LLVHRYLGCHLGNEAGIYELLDRAIQCARADLEGAAGAPFDLLHDGVAVTLALAQSQPTGSDAKIAVVGAKQLSLGYDGRLRLQ